MYQIERLQTDLSRRFPDLTIKLDEPADKENGIWHLDVWRQDDLPPVVVEWRRDRGFGLSTPGPDDFGVGVDEVYPNIRAAYQRVVGLVLSGGKTCPPTAVRLAELRQACKLSQAELAERIGIQQAAVARLESGRDLRIGTLARVVEAMGATLSIRAMFPDGVERELRF